VVKYGTERCRLSNVVCQIQNNNRSGGDKNLKVRYTQGYQRESTEIKENTMSKIQLKGLKDLV
jgi:hypothetical protein